MYRARMRRQSSRASRRSQRARRAFGTTATAAAFVLITSVGCTDDASAPPAGAETGSHPIETTLAFASSTSEEISVTDWTAIRAELDDGEAAEEEPASLLLSLTEAGASTFVTYESEDFPDHESAWGWDVFDLAWEGYFASEESGSVYILRFADGFDLAPVIDRFEQRDYEMEEVNGIPVYAHPGEPTSIDEEWFATDFGPRAPLAVLNAGVFEEENILVFSTSKSGVEEAIATFSGETSSAAEDESYTALVDEVEGSIGAFFAPGETLCDQAAGGLTIPAVTERLEEYRGHQYEAGAAAYFLEEGNPSGVFAFHYPSAEEAEADLDLRSNAAGGESLVTLEPYAANTFQLEEASVDGQDLLLELGPSESGQLALGAAIVEGDLLFAAC